MIAVDTNVLVLAARDRSDVGDYLRSQLDNRRTDIRVPVFCVGEFWRVATHPQAPQSMSAGDASSFLRSLLGRPRTLLKPGRSYWPLLRGLLADGSPASHEIFDYQIASLCIEHRCEAIWTFDARFPTFGRFARLDPLAQSTL